MSKKNLIIRSLAVLLIVYVFVYKEKPFNNSNDQKLQVKLSERTCNQRYLILENTDLDYTLRMIEEYGKILGDSVNRVEYRFDVGIINQWLVIAVDSALDNYEYYNLQSWFYGFEKNDNTPTFTMGLLLGDEIETKSYLFYTDLKRTASDAVIGTYSTDENFTIYLPEAYEKDAIKTNNGNSINFYEIISELKDRGFDIAKIEDIRYKEYVIKMNKSS